MLSCADLAWLVANLSVIHAFVMTATTKGTFGLSRQLLAGQTTTSVCPVQHGGCSSAPGVIEMLTMLIAICMSLLSFPGPHAIEFASAVPGILHGTKRVITQRAGFGRGLAPNLHQSQLNLNPRSHGWLIFARFAEDLHLLMHPGLSG